MTRRKKSPWVLPASLIAATALSVALLSLISRGSRSKREGVIGRDAGVESARPEPPGKRPSGPLRSLPNETELATALEDTFIALNRDDRAGAESAREAVDVQLQALPEDVAVALEALLQEAQRARDVPEAGEAFIAAERQLNGSFEAAGLAYVVDVDVLESDARRVALFSLYRVVDEATYSASPASARVRHVERVDALSWQRSLAGFAVDGAADALLFASEIDAEVLNILATRHSGPAPILRPEAVAALAPAERSALSKLVRAALDAELAGIDRDVSTAAARREELFASWGDRLSSRGLSIRRPDGMRSPPELLEQLGNLVPEAELAELRALEDELSDRHAADIGGLRQRLAHDLERHEAQHILDRERQDDWKVSAALAHFGPQEGAAVDPTSMTGRALAEVSGYLAQMTTTDALVRVNLTYLLRYLLDAEFGGGERVAAALIYRELAARLRPGGPTFDSAWPEAGEVIAVYGELVTADPDAVRRAAREVWSDVFSQPLPAATRAAD